MSSFDYNLITQEKDTKIDTNQVQNNEICLNTNTEFSFEDLEENIQKFFFDKVMGESSKTQFQFQFELSLAQHVLTSS